MRKWFSGLAIGLFCVGLANSSNAATVTLTYTADNYISAWWVNGVAQVLGANSSDWTKSDTAVLDLLDNTNYSFVWYLGNLGTPTQDGETPGGNPAAFLAKITGDIVGGSLFSNADGGWGAAIGPVPGPNVFNFPGWSWDYRYITSFGEYGASTGPWGTRDGLSRFVGSDSEWIWKAGNATPIYLMTSFQTTGADPVPEPATMILFGTGLAGLAAARRRKKAC